MRESANDALVLKHWVMAEVHEKCQGKQNSHDFARLANSCVINRLKGCALGDLWQFGERFRAAGMIRRDEDVSRDRAARPESVVIDKSCVDRSQSPCGLSGTTRVEGLPRSDRRRASGPFQDCPI